VNGAQLFWPISNVWYVEGYALDQFAAGDWGLTPVHRNAIGLLLDADIEEDLMYRHLQVADAARATLGIDISDWVKTDAPVGVTLKAAASGATWGTIANPDTLLRGAEKLIHRGATAIAVVVRFPDDEGSTALMHYRQGHGVDPLAGAEAVISHLIVRTFRVPCAHAPALRPLPLDPGLAPKSAAEEIGYTFLPCVLAGLSRAPQLTTVAESGSETLWRSQVDAVVVPATAFGGSGILHFAGTQAQVIAVEANTTTLKITPEALGMRALRVSTYLEAIGVMAAHKAGVNPGAIAPHMVALKTSSLGNYGEP
jgi:hypothetical protein